MIIVNSKEVKYDNDLNLKELLEKLNYNVSLTCCEVNKKLVKKSDYENFIVHDNDTIEVFSFVGGG